MVEHQGLLCWFHCEKLAAGSRLRICATGLDGICRGGRGHAENGFGEERDGHQGEERAPYFAGDVASVFRGVGDHSKVESGEEFLNGGAVERFCEVF